MKSKMETLKSAPNEPAAKNSSLAPVDIVLKRTNDKIFASPRAKIGDFDFGAKTAHVFDDMLVRSVPNYLEMQRMMAEMAVDFSVEGTNVVDLGCSTGTTLLMLDKVLPPGVNLVGIDYSPEMLKKAQEKIQQHGAHHDIRLICNDLNNGVEIKNASVVISNLTLQFVRPMHREKLMLSVVNGLVKNGVLLLVEKVLSRDTLFNRCFIKYYYDFKQRNGYSQMEISQKREALENVLIPYRTQENEELMLRAGFTDCEIFLKWYNFCGYIARKGTPARIRPKTRRKP